MASGPNVFVSYASDTKPLAVELANALTSHGMEPWVDFKDLHPGQPWPEELQRAIDEAQWFVILLGPGSRASRWQEAEWTAALASTWTHEEKRLLPVLFGESAPPPFLRNWIPLKVDSSTAPSVWTGRVVEILRNEGKNRRVANKDKGRLDEVEAAVEALRKVEG